MAQATFDPYLSTKVEHDSNVFRVPNSTAAAMYNNGNPALGDTDWWYIAGMDGTYLWDRQQLTEKLQFSHQNYANFTELNHSEYLARIALDWKLGSLFDGLLEYLQQKVQAPFALNDSTALTINTERNLAGKFNVKLAPEWRLETGMHFYELDSPLQFYPDYVERDVGTDIGIKYLGVAKLVYGFTISRLDGKFENAPNVAPFTQNTGNFNMAYTVSGLTTLTAAAGYTHRDQGIAEGTVSAATGELSYKRALTGKTSVTVEALRAVNSYLAAGGSEIDTSGSVTVNWQATYKLGTSVGYMFTHSSFVGQAIPNSIATGRVDNTPAATLNIKYQAFRHFLFQAYCSQTTRRSNVETFDFSDALFGISATAHWK